MKPVHLIVGHRGVGKSTWLKRLAAAASASQVSFIDLDQEIERASGRTIADWLAKGEAEFRRYEVATLAQLCDTDREVWISVGAGIENVPEDVHVLWLRRSTDRRGRVFINRPRLDAHVSPYVEYMERWAVRERRFRAWAHDEVWLPEGYTGGLESFYLGTPANLPFDLTLLPSHFKNWPETWRRLRNWNIRRLELRDDLLNDEQVTLAREAISGEHLLFSRRRPGESREAAGMAMDWALELGSAPAGVEIVSLHSRVGALSADLSRLTAAAGSAIAKLAVEVHSFEELWLGHQWWRENPERRAFLPRSTNGRWRWYRTLFGPQMPLHFFREGDGSSFDQPYVWEILKTPRCEGAFAAVLGSPIEHSRSPAEHREFFAAQNIPFVAIDVSDDEWGTAWPVLENLGLKFAAVTAPLKKNAAGVARGEPNAEAINTLWLEGACWRGANTDSLALKEIAAEFKSYESIWVWGAGAVTKSVTEAFPKAEVFSARAGTNRSDSPQLLIWATGRGRPFTWPPETCRPQLVLDLNYTDDSPGLEWAITQGVLYKSGLQMFELQADEQRKLWSR